MTIALLMGAVRKNTWTGPPIVRVAETFSIRDKSPFNRVISLLDVAPRQKLSHLLWRQWQKMMNPSSIEEEAAISYLRVRCQKPTKNSEMKWSSFSPFLWRITDGGRRVND